MCGSLFRVRGLGGGGGGDFLESRISSGYRFLVKPCQLCLMHECFDAS